MIQNITKIEKIDIIKSIILILFKKDERIHKL